MKKLGLLSLILFTAIACDAQRKVLIIGIDGCRPDALVLANCPNIEGLMATGVYTLNGNTHPPTISGPGWSSMLCGVWEQKHGVKDNTFVGSQYPTWPHFFDRLQVVDPSLYIASICHWSPINTNILANADLEQNYATDAEVKTAAVDLLTNGDPDLLFLHFDDVDAAGHAAGHLPSNPGYINAIQVVDGLVGQVLTALATRPLSEEWMVCVVTDHGGNAAGHGGITPEEQRIFSVFSSPLLEPQEIPAERDTVVLPSTIAFNNAGHVQVQNSAAYQFGTTQDFTIECRVRMPTTWTGDPSFVSNKNWNSGLNAGFVISTTGTGYTWKLNIGDGVDRIDLNGLPLTDGQWHHLAFTCDRDGMARIFQDGLFLREASMALIGNISTALALRFGQDGTGTYGVAMPGSISEVRAWNAALPINTVSEWSGRALSGSHPFAANLIGHWRMSEGAGTTLANQVAGASAAQWNGTAPAWQAGGALLITTDLAHTPAQVDLPPTVLAHLCMANNPAWELDGKSLIPVCAPVAVQARVLLDGPYDMGTGLMHDSLRTYALIPVTEPFTVLGVDHVGFGGGEQLLGAVLSTTGANAVVDWVLMEERNGTDATRVLSTRSALVQRDGDIVDTDGSPLIWRTILGAHHLVVRHRNHMGSMSFAPLNFSLGASLAADFTSPSLPLFGMDAMRDRNGVRTLWVGDVVRDGVVRYVGSENDRDPILTAIGGTVPTAVASGYLQADVNMDGKVKYVGLGNDRDPILQAVGGSTPTSTRSEQVP